MTAAALLPAPESAAAERAWIKDEVRLNIRTGPGLQFRIVSALETGDLVEILERGDGWTKVQLRGHETGWIPAGYLQSEPPARVLLARHEEQTADLRRQVEALSQKSNELRGENETLASRDSGQSAEIQRLTEENMKLRAGARWPEWIAGASLLAAGMMLGAILHRNANRRTGPRIRL